MGRRKIEIKAIKDDRNRSVTFLKRKGGLFKKAHELSVLCSVDVAVFIFGNNKKLYEYSSSDMHDLITRYTYHGGPSEHKGPADFGNGDDDDEEDGDGTPPHGLPEGADHPQMMPPHFPGQQQASFPQIRHHTPSASPPIANGAPFQGHPNHHLQRGHTPQPPGGSRPASRNDGRRIGPSMISQSVGPSGAHPGITYMPTPPIYNPPPPHPNMAPQPGAPYPYQPAQQPYVDDRRPSGTPGFQQPQPPPPPPPQTIPVTARREPSPPQPGHEQLPGQQPIPHISAPPQEPERRLQGPQPPPAIEPKTEGLERPQAPLLNTESAIKKLPARKSHSIFTPIEENQSILSQHLASFSSEPQARGELAAAAAAAAARSHTGEAGYASRNGNTSSPPLPQRSGPQAATDKAQAVSVSSAAESGFTPPSRTNSITMGSAGGGTRPRGPRLTVQIPDGGSEPGSGTGESPSPRNPADPSHAPHRQNSHSSMVLPPPSPSASAILSAGATGPPNPFARPPPQQNVNGDTPVSALPSRFLNNEFLPSPSGFYQDWNFRASDSNTLPSPLNFTTPVVGSGPSFLRDEGGNSRDHSQGHGAGPAVSAPQGGTTAAPSGGSTAPGPTKRKSPEYGGGEQGDARDSSKEPKRVKVE